MPPGLREFEKEVEDGLDAIKDGLGRVRLSGRQSSLRRKVDEMVLVGKGAPA